MITVKFGGNSEDAIRICRKHFRVSRSLQKKFLVSSQSTILGRAVQDIMYDLNRYYSISVG